MIAARNFFITFHFEMTIAYEQDEIQTRGFLQKTWERQNYSLLGDSFFHNLRAVHNLAKKEKFDFFSAFLKILERLPYINRKLRISAFHYKSLFFSIIFCSFATAQSLRLIGPILRPRRQNHARVVASDVTHNAPYWCRGTSISSKWLAGNVVL